jgi:hypothetical protein
MGLFAGKNTREVYKKNTGLCNDLGAFWTRRPLLKFALITPDRSVGWGRHCQGECFDRIGHCSSICLLVYQST